MIVCFVIEIMMVMMGDRGSEKGDVVTKKINDVKQNPHRSISNSTFSKTKSSPTSIATSSSSPPLPSSSHPNKIHPILLPLSIPL